MNDSPTTPQTTADLRTELDRQKAQNEAVLRLLSKMEQLWPDDEKAKVQSLIAEAEATKAVLRHCAERLEDIP